MEIALLLEQFNYLLTIISTFYALYFILAAYLFYFIYWILNGSLGLFIWSFYAIVNMCYRHVLTLQKALYPCIFLQQKKFMNRSFGFIRRDSNFSQGRLVFFQLTLLWLKSLECVRAFNHIWVILLAVYILFPFPPIRSSLDFEILDLDSYFRRALTCPT